MLLNPNLDGPVVDNTIAGWNTVAATLSMVDQDGRSGVLSVADAGSFSSVYQTIPTTPGAQYFITFDVWAVRPHQLSSSPPCRVLLLRSAPHRFLKFVVPL